MLTFSTTFSFSFSAGRFSQSERRNGFSMPCLSSTATTARWPSASLCTRCASIGKAVPSSEETIDGTAFPMEAHLVHKDAEGHLAGVAVLLRQGIENPFLRSLWENLPAEKEKEKVVEKVSINAASLLPKSRAYYTFAGSLTTPPCSEGVRWLVLTAPVDLSASQVARFDKIYS